MFVRTVCMFSLIVIRVAVMAPLVGFGRMPAIFMFAIRAALGVLLGVLMLRVRRQSRRQGERARND